MILVTQFKGRWIVHKAAMRGNFAAGMGRAQ
jgi:hypothetical protein